MSMWELRPRLEHRVRQPAITLQPRLHPHHSIRTRSGPTMSSNASAHPLSADPLTSFTHRANALTAKLAVEGDNYAEWFAEVRALFVRLNNRFLLPFGY